MEVNETCNPKLQMLNIMVVNYYSETKVQTQRYEFLLFCNPCKKQLSMNEIVEKL